MIPRSQLLWSALITSATAAGLPAQGLQFTDVTNSSGVAILTDTVTYGTGLCVGDFDGDGDLDLVTPTRPGFPIAYWRNEGNMVFSDQTATAGLGNGRVATELCAVDVDNDGDQDLFVSNWRSPAQLFINDGTGVFADQADGRGFLHISTNWAASFGDYDNDGWLDLFLGNRDAATPTPYPGNAEPDILYRNVGNGHFQDVTTASGLFSTGLTLAAAFFDYDEDGWPDVYMAHDKGPANTPNDLFRNNRDGTFTSVAASLNARIAVDGMGFDFADVFNDGGVDFYVTDLPSDHLFQVWDPTTQTYLEVQSNFGLEGGGTGWALQFADFDLDGWEDLYVTQAQDPNLLFLNPATPFAAQQPWTDVAPAAGCAVIPTVAGSNQYTALLADLDNDGDMDIVNRLAGFFGNGIAIFRNDQQGGHYLRVELEGTTSNRDARGAVLVAEANGQTMRRWMKSGTGFKADSDRRPLFGLGSATVVDSLSVRWPSGTHQRLFQIPGDQTISLLEPKFEMIGQPQISKTVTLQLTSEADVGATSVVVVSAQATPHTLLPDGTELPLFLDGLANALLVPGNGILNGAVGTVDPSGTAAATLTIPANPGLIGLRLFSTAITLDAQQLGTVRTWFERPLSFTIF